MNYQEIKITDKDLIKTLSCLATQIVREHYDPILGVKQNDYMLAKFQSTSGITAQLNNGYKYYLVQSSGENLGFIAYCVRENDIYLSKFYLRKDHRGKGVSKDMLRFLVEQARKASRNNIVLNVNKHNDAIKAYKKLGFVRIGAEKIDIGNGYFMDDYVYQYVIG